MKKFKVRDTITKKYWNGDIRRSSFGDKGKLWNSRKQIENNISYYINNNNRWSAYYKIEAHNPPKNWEIVEVEIVEKETTSSSLTDFLQFVALKAKVVDQHHGFGAGHFLDTMYRKGVLDKIEFLIMIKPSENSRSIDMTRIKEAREQLRQLGVKTRSFRESSGCFGMMDREQAMKARLVLDVDWIIDLKAIRNSIQI